MWKWMGLFSKKSHLKILGESFSSKLNWSSDMVSTVKTALKKLEPQFFLKFLSSDVYFNSVKLLYIYIKPTCIEYCHCVWAGCSSCYLNIWDKLQKWYVGLLILYMLIETLAHCRNVVRLSLFSRHYFSTCSSKLAELVSLPYSRERSYRYSNRMRNFSVIPRCYKDVYVNSIFSHTTGPWNYLPAKRFPLIYNLKSFISAVNRRIFNLFFKQFS